MSTEELRRTNLRALVEQWGGPSSFAKKLGYTGPSYVSQMLSSDRPVTEKTARKIEKVLELSGGWMDKDHSNGGTTPVPQAPVDVDEDLVTQVIAAVGEALEQAGVTLSSQRFADLVTVAYQHALANGNSIDRGYVGRLVKLTKS